MTELFRWSHAESSIRNMQLPPRVQQHLRQLDGMSARQAMIQMGRDKAWACADGELVRSASLLLQTLDSDKAYAHMGKHVALDDLPGHAEEVVHVLKENNIIVQRADGSGVQEIALHAPSLKVDGGMVLGGAIEVIALPCPKDLKNASKLELVFQLVREGWAPVDLAVDPITPGGAREISISMLLRSKVYFEALVDA